MTLFEKFFTASHQTLTDYGVCQNVYPYLDYEFSDQNNISMGNYNGSTFYNQVISSQFFFDH